MPPVATEPALIPPPLALEITPLAADSTPPLTPPVPTWTPRAEETPTPPPGVVAAAAAANATVVALATAAVATAIAAFGGEVVIREFAFEPATLPVRSGQTVVWRNLDAAVHTVSFQGTVIESGPLAQGLTFASVMQRPGTWVYHCTIHPNITGRIVVSQ